MHPSDKAFVVERLCGWRRLDLFILSLHHARHWFGAKKGELLSIPKLLSFPDGHIQLITRFDISQIKTEALYFIVLIFVTARQHYHFSMTKKPTVLCLKPLCDPNGK